MKLNFTHFTSLCCLLLLGFGLNAQNSNTCIITEPASIAGEYTALAANFGGNASATATYISTFALDGVGVVTDACDEPIENVNGKLAFIDREGQNCEFGAKALAVQTAGAVAAIICNDSGNAGRGIMGLDGGAMSGSVTIPVWGMSYDDCLIIRQVAESSDIELEMTYQCRVPSYPERVIWGDEPGQGDFENGLNGWTVINEKDTSWTWTDNPAIPGFYTNATFAAPTSCNGFMMFPSDFLDNGGEADPLRPGVANFGGGPCPAFNAGGCSGSLISPVIDLSGEEVDGLFVRFTQMYRFFTNTNTNLIASYDGGTTWPDTISAAQFAVVNAGNLTETVEVPLRLYNGEPSVQLQFAHFGNYYYYGIDDITLVNDSYFDIRLLRTFYAAAPAWEIPLSQAQDVPFHMDIFNQGNIDGSGITTQAEVFGPAGDLVATYTHDEYATQPAYTFLNENSSFRETFVPTEIGTYTVLMSNISEGDSDASNDTLSYRFNITEDTWLTAPQPSPAADGDWPNYFDGLIFNDPTNGNFIGLKYALAYSFYLPNGEDHYLNSIRFGIDDKASNSGDIFVYLYAWVPGPDAFSDDGQDGVASILGNYQINSADLKLLGAMGEDNSFGIQSDRVLLNPNLGVSRRDITVNMAKANPLTGAPELTGDGRLQPIPLLDDTRYVVVFAIVPTSTNDNDFIDFLATSSTDNEITRQWASDGTNIAMDTTDINRYYGATAKSLTDGNFQEVDNLSFDGNIGGTAFATLFEQNQPWIEMVISDTPVDSPLFVNTEELTESAASSISIYPNPVTEVMNIEVALEQASPSLSLELSDINGKLVRKANYTNIQKQLLKVDVKDLPSGVYTLNVRSEEGFTSKKVIINN